MRATLLSTLAILLAAGLCQARFEPDPILTRQAPLPGESKSDYSRSTVTLRADTVWYGDYEIIDGTYYARSSTNRQDVLWTFDRGNGPFGDPDRLENGGGWKAFDPDRVDEVYGRVIDETLDLGDGIAPPVLSGAQSLWIGISGPEADSLCYDCGAGYGNSWVQGVTSEPLFYNGVGDVSLSLLYFNDSEACYDGTQIYLRREDETRLLLNPYPIGQCENNTGWERGTFTGLIGSPEAPASYERTIAAGEIGDSQDVRIEFEFYADGGWSDEDCQYATTQGPITIDDIAIEGGGIDTFYDFEDGLQGWIPFAVPGSEDQVSITDISCYEQYDTCGCSLDGNILEFHRLECDDGDYWDGDHLGVESPICIIDSPGGNDFFLEFDTFARPFRSGYVYIRIWWSYYPWTCPETGEETWSPKSGCSELYGSGFGCFKHRIGAAACGIPQTAEKLVAYLEAVCIDGFGFGCFTPWPLFDNLVIGVVPYAEGYAPTISVHGGTEFQDTGSSPSDLFDVRAPGPADVTRMLDFEDPLAPAALGDSLVVLGPEPAGHPELRWEAKLWWRVARRGPMQSDLADGLPTRYKLWRDRVADGKRIDLPHHPEFTWGWMDSAQTGYQIHRDRMRSTFREDDDDFVGENDPENDMLWDDIFVPGTRIEYFVTANYIATPGNLSYLPDTTGGNFYEFEVLPGVGLANVPDCGGEGFDQCLFLPATLYIDAYNHGAQSLIESALATVLNGVPLCEQEAGCPIPVDRNWDRYDYISDANYAAPFARRAAPGSTNGMTIGQILGYRSILLNTGAFGPGAMREEDFALFRDWLTNDACDANANRQLFVANGDAIGEILEGLPAGGEAFLNDVLGASLLCDAFHGRTEDPDCGPVNESYCVRLLPADGGPFGMDLDVDGYGSGCPNAYPFNVFEPTGTGVGNRSYSAEDGLKEADFAMIVSEDLSPGANYRAIVAAPSWHHMTERDPGGEEMSLCPREIPPIVAAVAGEIGAAMRWGFDAGSNDEIPKFASAESLATCQETWSFPSGVEGASGGRFVTRLHQNQPNPFNPGTTIRFSLAQLENVEITIYDVSGREVRRLVDGKREAGQHAAVWDGFDGGGRQVGSGIYWMQMVAGSYISNKKMVVLR